MSKIFNTRLQLKYDLYEKWMENDPVLLAGEVAVVNVPVAEAGKVDDDAPGYNKKPAILFKVGDGNTEFSKLPWASGLAADVYSWAKQSEKPSYKATEITIEDTEDNFIATTVEDALEEIWKKVLSLTGLDGEEGTIKEFVTDEIQKILPEAISAGDNSYIKGLYFGEDGKIKILEGTIPTYDLATGETAGTVKFNGKEVAVAGLGTAAFKAEEYFEKSGAAAAVLGEKTDTSENITVYGAFDAIAKESSARLEDLKNLGDIIGTLPENGKSIIETIEDAKDTAIDESKKYTDTELSNLKISIEKKENIDYIVIKDNDGNEISSTNASAFVKDGMLTKVVYDQEDNVLKLTWNTDSVLEEDTETIIDLNDLVDIYTGGTGISVSNTGVISVDETIATKSEVEAVKNEIVGTEQDTSKDNTVFGIKKYTQETISEFSKDVGEIIDGINDKISNLDGTIKIAEQNSENLRVTIPTELSQVDGKVEAGENSITLSAVATTGHINSLEQDPDEYVIFYCGNSTKFTDEEPEAPKLKETITE